MDIDDISKDIIDLSNKFVNNLAPKKIYSQNDRIELKKFIIEKMSDYFKLYTDQEIIIGYQNFKKIIQNNIEEYILDFNENNENENETENEENKTKVTAYLLTKNFLNTESINFKNSLSLKDNNGYIIAINTNLFFQYISGAVDYYFNYTNFNNYTFIDLDKSLSSTSKSINKELLKTTVKHIVESGLYNNIKYNEHINYGEIQEIKKIFMEILNNSYEMNISLNDIFVINDEEQEVKIKNFKNKISKYKFDIEKKENQKIEDVAEDVNGINEIVIDKQTHLKVNK